MNQVPQFPESVAVPVVTGTSSWPGRGRDEKSPIRTTRWCSKAGARTADQGAQDRGGVTSVTSGRAGRAEEAPRRRRQDCRAGRPHGSCPARNRSLPPRGKSEATSSRLPCGAWSGEQLIGRRSPPGKWRITRAMWSKLDQRLANRPPGMSAAKSRREIRAQRRPWSAPGRQDQRVP